MVLLKVPLPFLSGSSQMRSWGILWVSGSLPAVGTVLPLSAAKCPEAEQNTQSENPTGPDLIHKNHPQRVLTCLFLWRWGESCCEHMWPAGGKQRSSHGDSDRQTDRITLQLKCNLITQCFCSPDYFRLRQAFFSTSGNVLSQMNTSDWTMKKCQSHGVYVTVLWTFPVLSINQSSLFKVLIFTFQ